MPIIRHALWGIRQRRETDRDLYDCGIQVVGKPPDNFGFNPHEFAAEYACAELARALRLPVAHGVIAQDDNGVDWYCSFNFNTVSPQKMPPWFGTADKPSPVSLRRAIAFAKRDRWLACGITAFDIWVVNTDRSDDNLVVNEVSGKACIFDHGEALIRSPNPREHLENNRDRIGFRYHCIAPAIDTTEPLLAWCDRINEIPEYYIREVLQDTTDLGVDAEVASFCAEFLIDRREKLPQLIAENPDVFPRAPNLFMVAEPQESKTIKRGRIYPSHLTWGSVGILSLSVDRFVREGGCDER